MDNQIWESSIAEITVLLERVKKHYEDEYKGKWIIAKLPKYCFERYDVRKNYIPFKVSSVRFKSASINDNRFLKTLVFSGTSITGKKKSQSISIDDDNIEVFDSYDAAALYVELLN